MTVPKDKTTTLSHRHDPHLNIRSSISSSIRGLSSISTNYYYSPGPDDSSTTTWRGRHLDTSVPPWMWDVPPPAPSSCSPYETLDWAVFGFFLAGCVVLAACLVGYAFVIDRYQKQEHRDNYQAVQDVVGEGALVMVEVGPSSETGMDHVPSAPTPFHRENSSTSRMGQVEMKHQNTAVLPTTNDDPGRTTVDGSRTPVSYHDDTTPPLPPLPLPTAYVGGVEHGNRIVVSDDFVDEETVEPEEYTDEENEWAVFSAIKGPWTTIFLVFALTLCLFPSWVSQLRSVHQCQHHNRMVNDLYTPLSFVVFNVGDLCGRLLSEHVPVSHIRHLSSKLVAAALGRLVVFPLLFVMCVTEDPRQWFPIIPHDAYSWAVLFFFALTNGLLVSVSFMHAPHLVAHNTTMQERASEMMTFSVSFGLLMGSLLSFPFATVASWL